jgi:uncharacterized RDD family membrane protein YckC
MSESVRRGAREQAPPPDVRPIPPRAVGPPLAGVGARMGAAAIDIAFLFAWGYVLGLLFDQEALAEAGRISFSLSGEPALIWLATLFAYPIIAEASIGATFGKLLLGLRVVMEDGRAVGVWASVVRNLLRVVDFLPVFYIAGLAFMANSDKLQRLGDRVARTLVIKRAA